MGAKPARSLLVMTLAMVAAACIGSSPHALSIVEGAGPLEPRIRGTLDEPLPLEIEAVDPSGHGMRVT